MGFFSWLDRKINGEPKNQYGIRPPYEVYTWDQVINEHRISPRSFVLLIKLETRIPLKRISLDVTRSLNAWVEEGVTANVLTHEEGDVLLATWYGQPEVKPMSQIIEEAGGFL